MELIRIQRILNKTDLGISGKNGTEILLDSNTKEYFDDIQKNQTIDCVNLNDSSILTLKKKVEASQKFTSPSLKKYFSKYSIKEGDIFELFILKQNDFTKLYFINLIPTNYLLFKMNSNTKDFYSISEEKLNKIMYNDNSLEVKNNGNKLLLELSEKRKLRSDSKESIQHYSLNVEYDIFKLDLKSFDVNEVKKLTEIEIFKDVNIVVDNDFSIQKIRNLINRIIYAKPTIDEQLTTETIDSPTTIVSKIRPSSRIISTLGKDLIKDVYAAIIELVKNSYDADSKSVNIILKYDKKNNLLKTIVEDKGHGMSLKTITDIWLVPATSDKLIRKRSPKGRILQGKKGIGRYAAGILGDLLLVESTDSNLNLSRILVDFDEITNSEFLSDIDILIETGLKGNNSGVIMDITLSEAKESDVLELWDAQQLEKLELELKKLKSPLVKNTEDKFEITLEYKDLPFRNSKNEIIYLTEKKTIDPLPILDYYDYRIHGEIDNTGKAIIYYYNQNMESLKEEKIELQINLKNNQQYCGNIKLDYRVFDRDPESIDRLLNRGLKSFSLGKTEAKKLLDSMYGIGIYRDIFRIRPYGDQDYDWLDLDKDRVQNPSYAIGMNQIIGFIEIENENFSGLYEKSARDGLIENSNFLALQFMAKEVLEKILQPKRFNFRQQAGRGRKVKNISERIDNLFDFNTIKEKVKSLGLNKSNEEKVIKIIQQEQKNKEKDLEEIKNTIAVYQGQVTLGKMTDVLLHEGRKSIRYLKEQLPRINKWNKDFLENHDEELMKDIELRSNNTLSHVFNLRNLFKRIEPLSIGRLPNKKETNIYDSIQNALLVYESKFKEQKIHIYNEIDKALILYAREYDIYTAFINFIENSLYWLENSNIENKFIKFSSKNALTTVLITMYDNGPGISSEYANSVFEPGFSLKNGTGLGMPIAAEALKRSNANVLIGEVDKGTILYIEFNKENI